MSVIRNHIFLVIGKIFVIYNSEENTPGSLGVLGLQLRAESASSNKGLFHPVSQWPFAGRGP